MTRRPSENSQPSEFGFLEDLEQIIESVTEDLQLTLADFLGSSREAGAVSVHLPMTEDVDPIEHTARFFANVARCMGELHDGGQVLGDVTPRTIAVDSRGNGVLLRRRDARKGGSAAVGAPAYKSPQQIRGAAPDVAADVYALGVCAYEGLTLRRPFESATLEGLFDAIVAGGASSASDENPDVPRDLAAVLDRALATDPRQRYATAIELAEDLERFVAGTPVLAGRGRIWNRLRGLLGRARGA